MNCLCSPYFGLSRTSDTTKLLEVDNMETDEYDYDLVVVGGGSGGLAASQEAAKFGKKVAVCDYVKPTPKGTKWGLGGTCVNVGCIPKKLMHTAGLVGQHLKDSASFGWDTPSEINHKWSSLVENVHEHIFSLNWAYKVALKDKKVTYLNSFVEFLDSHTLKCTNKKGVSTVIRAESILLATGGRPRYPDIPGAVEFGITSDDLFSLRYYPKKTLLVGASYISLECAGFLAEIGTDVTVMVRSIFLRGFDQQMANLVGENMEKFHHVKFIRQCVPTKVEKIEDGDPGLLKVTGCYSNGEEFEDEFNTVIFAIGRDVCTAGIGLERVGLSLDKKGKVICNEAERSSVENIYAIGDVLSGGLELTPVAIQAGRLLARRLYNGSSVLTEYNLVPTTVFTPLEYSCTGYSEEDAIDKWGADDIEVYHQQFVPLEFTVPGRKKERCYMKLICIKSEDEHVVGAHYLGPNAGEVMQGIAIAMKLGVKKSTFDNTIGIHPTCAESFTTLSVTKASGQSEEATAC